MRKSITTAEEATQVLLDLNNFASEIRENTLSLSDLNTQLQAAIQQRALSKNSLKKVYTQPFTNVEYLSHFLNHTLP